MKPIRLILPFVASFLLAVPLVAQDAPPNIIYIIYIMADDLGAGSLGCYGQDLIKTPNIDKLSAEGIRFTQSYSGAHVCRPARSTLMTGKHTGHTPIRANGMKRFLYASDVTVAELLQDAGYITGGFGKWGLGDPDTPGVATNQGFDEWFGHYTQVHAHFYYPYWLWENDEKYMLPGNFKGERKQYMHDELHAKAKDFITREKNGPFFAYLAYTIPHVELTVPEDSEKPYRGQFPKVAIQDPRANYLGSEDGYTTLAGMITRLDDQVGEIMALLKELGIDGNTIVFFTSDNGAQGGGKKTTNNKPGWQDMSDFFNASGGLRGYKGSFYEGGLRVPLIARWPGKIKPGRVTDHQTAFWDFLPTACELAKIRKGKIPNDIDGLSYAPTLLGRAKRQKKHEYLYWEYPNKRGVGQAIRMGNWKGVKPRPDRPMELYNLKTDEAETKNLAADKPDIVKQLTEHMAAAHTPERNYKPEEVRPNVFDYVQFE